MPAPLHKPTLLSPKDIAGKAQEQHSDSGREELKPFRFPACEVLEDAVLLVFSARAPHHTCLTHNP